MSKKKKDDDSLDVHQTIHIAPEPPATEVRVTGPDTDFVVKQANGTLSHTYGSEDAWLGGGIDWSFAQPGEYTLRHMDAHGVEYQVLTVKVK